MYGSPPTLHQLKELFDEHGIPAFLGKEWNTEYLSVPIAVDEQNHCTVSARFGCINGQPVLTNLPHDRYVCVRIPRFYQWWDDLKEFTAILQQANSMAYTLAQRDAQLEFFIDFVDCDVIFFRMDVPLKSDETYSDAVLDVYRQLSAIAVSVYSYLNNYNDEYASL